jgi:hypothetical protein
MKPRRLEAMLDELSALATAVTAGAPLRRPRVTLYLSSGRSLEGELLEVIRDGGVSMVSLQFPHPSSDTAFVPLTSLEALSVRDVTELDKRVSDTPAPSVLTLRRAFSLAGDRWRTLRLPLNFTLPEDLNDDTTREALMEVLGHVEAAVEGLQTDELGRAALTQPLEFKFAMGSTAGVTRDGAVLTVTVPQHFAQRPDRQGWRTLLEAQL